MVKVVEGRVIYIGLSVSSDRRLSINFYLENDVTDYHSELTGHLTVNGRLATNSDVVAWLGNGSSLPVLARVHVDTEKYVFVRAVEFFDGEPA